MGSAFGPGPPSLYLQGRSLHWRLLEGSTPGATGSAYPRGCGPKEPAVGAPSRGTVAGGHPYPRRHLPRPHLGKARLAMARGGSGARCPGRPVAGNAVRSAQCGLQHMNVYISRNGFRATPHAGRGSPAGRQRSRACAWRASTASPQDPMSEHRCRSVPTTRAVAPSACRGGSLQGMTLRSHEFLGTEKRTLQILSAGTIPIPRPVSRPGHGWLRERKP